jgi:hypothetical protein
MLPPEEVAVVPPEVLPEAPLEEDAAPVVAATDDEPPVELATVEVDAIWPDVPSVVPAPTVVADPELAAALVTGARLELLHPSASGPIPSAITRVYLPIAASYRSRR